MDRNIIIDRLCRWFSLSHCSPRSLLYIRHGFGLLLMQRHQRYFDGIRVCQSKNYCRVAIQHWIYSEICTCWINSRKWRTNSEMLFMFCDFGVVKRVNKPNKSNEINNKGSFIFLDFYVFRLVVVASLRFNIIYWDWLSSDVCII